jgi:hypothetical protein
MAGSTRLLGFFGQDRGEAEPETGAESLFGSLVPGWVFETLIKSGQFENMFTGLLPGHGAGTIPGIRPPLVAPYQNGRPRATIRRIRDQGEALAEKFEAAEIG